MRRALHNRRLLSALVAYLAFNVAEWASWIAVLVWAFDRDGVQGAGVVALVQLVPAALLASPAAVLLSRLSRPWALTIGYAAQAIAFAALGLELALDSPLALVIFTAIVAAVMVTLTRPVHNSLLPELSETTGDLTAGNAATGMAEAVATFIGPLASGIILTWAGPGSVLLLCGFLLLGATVAAGTLLRSQAAAPQVIAASVPRTSVRAVLRDPKARLFSGLVAAEYVLVGVLDILLVVLALDLHDMGDGGPGLLNAALGVGALVGATATFLLVGRSRLAPVVVAAAVISGVAITGAGYAPGVPLAILLVAIGGGGRLFFDVGNRTFVQRVLPDRLLGAVFGLQESMMMAGLALGSIAAPALVGMFGARGAFAAAGLFLPVVALLAWRPLARIDAGTKIPLHVLELLQAVPILAVLPPRILERLARDAVEVRTEPGTPVVTEGQPGDRFYVVATGALEVSHGDDVIRELGPGAWFGELALLRDAPRSATVTTTSAARLWALNRDAFLGAVTGNPVPAQVADEHARRNYR